MKDIKTCLILFTMLPVWSNIQAQACNDFFPQREGTVLKYVNYDRKDDVTGRNELSFREKRQITDGVSVIFASKFSDDKEEVIYESELEVACVNGVIRFDLGKFLDPSTMSAYEDMDVEVSGDNLEMPLTGAAGTLLDGGSVTAVVRMNGIKVITLSVAISNRKIDAREKVTTPAGTFNCIKYSYDALTHVGFVKVTSSAVEWYSSDYGTVRSESYNKKGKLLGYTLLESISE